MATEETLSSTGGNAAFASPTRLLVLQSTPFCNIDCSYCYLPDRTARVRMPDGVLEAIAGKIFHSRLVGRELSVLWHAGEPLVLGPAYYENAFAILGKGAPASLALTHKFQTNGTLVNRQWCEFFKAHHAVVGLSIDGPERFHDRYRRTRNGEGTFAKALRAIELMHAHELPFYVICVLTADSLDYAEEFFEFFQAQGATRVLFNMEEIEGSNRQSSLDRPGTEQRYKNFLSRYFDLLVQSGSAQLVRELHDTVSNILAHRRTPIYNVLTEPFATLTVDAAGNVSTFSPELLAARDERYGGFALGNLLTDEIEDLMRSPKFAGFAAEIAAGVEGCRQSCEYFGVCGGGSPSNKLAETGRLDTTETLYCRITVKAVTDLMLEKLAGDQPLPQGHSATVCQDGDVAAQ
jgi:uncharacterized protein